VQLAARGIMHRQTAQLAFIAAGHGGHRRVAAGMIPMLLGRACTTREAGTTRTAGLLPARSNQRRHADAGEDAGAETVVIGAS
jgi:hypothetical protein